MRLIKMTGGLGNQMFIYAFYLAMKTRHSDVRIDLSDMMHYHEHNGYELQRIFNLHENEFCINQKLKKVIEFLFFKTIIERKQNLQTLHAFEKDYLWPFVYFKGFYQSERYFSEIKDDVRKAFTFDVNLTNCETRNILKLIENQPNAVSLHIRRGDYTLPKYWNIMGRICTLDYYNEAIRRMQTKINNPHFYVFSDDSDWVRKHLSLSEATFVDFNKGKDNWQDMLLMSRCRHHIICNSTFSWWGAWLNSHDDKIVMAPDKWFANVDTPYIIPEKWTKIPVKI